MKQLRQLAPLLYIGGERLPKAVRGGDFDHQKDLIPPLATLAAGLCPSLIKEGSFQKIYFHTTLNLSHTKGISSENSFPIAGNILEKNLL